MKQEISTLMDGELFEDEALPVLASVKKSTEMQQTWQTYHLIGDVLRQPEHICRDMGATFHQRLQLEPTVIAPKRIAKHKVRNYALSAAASLMGLALVIWLSSQITLTPTPQIAMSTTSGNIQPVNLTLQSSVNDYLIAHQEYSPSTQVHGATSYIHAVAER